jgi:hypothetical protein
VVKSSSTRSLPAEPAGQLIRFWTSSPIKERRMQLRNRRAAVLLALYATACTAFPIHTFKPSATDKYLEDYQLDDEYEQPDVRARAHGVSAQEHHVRGDAPPREVRAVAKHGDCRNPHGDLGHTGNHCCLRSSVCTASRTWYA